MSAVEDFENAPVGATATHKATGNRAMKIDDSEQGWIIRTEDYLADEEMVSWGYTLDRPAPESAREALELAWELAHEVKPGQVLPEGTHYLEVTASGVKEYVATLISPTDLHDGSSIRTLEPLHEPEPDWLDAPAVLAACGCRGIELWHPHESKDGMWVSSACGEYALWSSLRYVTPLYPEGEKK